MAEVVAADLRELGAENVTVDEHVYAVRRQARVWRTLPTLVSAATLICFGSPG